MNHVSKRVWILSFVSLLTDMAGEMLYPVMPVYLESIGFSMALIGILEGLAEATVGLSKGYFGKLSDITGKRVLFVQIGYFFSSISKPMMAVFQVPLWIFFSRTLDRLGKGIRSAARDAILSEEATIETKGKIFGFHRSFDTVGATIGPIIALLYLHFHPEEYKILFAFALIPGVLAVFLSLLLKEKKLIKINKNKFPYFFSYVKYWKSSTSDYKKIVIGLLIFALFNSSDFFLLLRAKQSGMSDEMTIGIYILYNFVYALLAYPMGILSDKTGIKNIFIFGLLMFSVVYFGMALFKEKYFILSMFILYGFFAAATEGISKAWISNICKEQDVATAIGTYASFQSICSLMASSLTGMIWFYFGPAVALSTSAAVALFLIIYFMFCLTEKKYQTFGKT